MSSSKSSLTPIDVEVDPRRWKSAAREIVDNVLQETLLGVMVAIAICITATEQIVSLLLPDESPPPPPF